MKKLTILLVGFLLIGTGLKADVGSYDVVKISYQDRTYYVRAHHIGELIENGLCYEGWDGEEINMYDHLMAEYGRQTKVQLYESVTYLKLNNFDSELWAEEEELVVFGGKISIGKFEFRNIEVLSASRGNTYGYTISKEMCEQDISWISDYPIEKICAVPGGELCSMVLFGIKGNFIKEDKIALEEYLKSKVVDQQILNLDEELSKLYKRYVFMIGFCSC